jgi:hypothetical protein
VRKYCTVVFGTETVAEIPGAGSAAFNEPADSDEYDDDEYSRDNDELGIGEVVTHELVIHCVLLCGNVRDGRG